MDKKKLIYILAGIMGFMIVIIIIVAIVSSIGGKKLSYEKIEDKMELAAVSYFKDNASALPKEEGKSVSVDSSTLVSGGYLKELSKMTPKDVNCSGKVIVTKSGNLYLYSPILNCGNAHKTEILTDVVNKNNPLVVSGDGLYSTGNGSRFKGEYINNYVQLGNYLWRILDIDSEGYMRLIYADKNLENKYVWDDRYNIDKKENVGINDYNVSRIKAALENLETTFLADDAKANLVYRTICIGKRSSNNLDINNNEECEVKISNQLFGLPYTADYVAASIDANCKKIDDESCANYNYLMNSSLSSWTLNGQKENSYKAFAVSRAGYSISTVSNERSIRPTVYLSNNAIYAGGTGAKKDPYIVK